MTSEGLIFVARCELTLDVTMCIVYTETSWGELESNPSFYLLLSLSTIMLYYVCFVSNFCQFEKDGR